MESMFQAVNVSVLPFWALMIFLPRWQGTRRLIGSSLILMPLAYVILLAPRAPELFPLVVSMKLADAASLLGRPEGALIGWIHFVALDLFAGRWMYLDSQERELSPWLMAPVLFLTLMAGPLGLLVYLTIRLFLDNAAIKRLGGPKSIARQGGQNG